MNIQNFNEEVDYMEEKVLCCCHNVTLKDVKAAISNGVQTFEELQEATQIGTDCPPCTENSKRVFTELINAK